jgi:hypothetical protein
MLSSDSICVAEALLKGANAVQDREKNSLYANRQAGESRPPSFFALRRAVCGLFCSITPAEDRGYAQGIALPRIFACPHPGPGGLFSMIQETKIIGSRTRMPCSGSTELAEVLLQGASTTNIEGTMNDGSVRASDDSTRLDALRLIYSSLCSCSRPWLFPAPLPCPASFGHRRIFDDSPAHSCRRYRF